MTLLIENVKEEFVPSLKAFVKAINAQCRAQKPSEKAKSPKSAFERAVLRADAQIERDIKSGKLKGYKSAKKMHEDILADA